MTAFNDFAQAQAVANTLRPSHHARTFMIGVQRVAGAALVLTSLALWLSPGSSWSGDLMSMKILMSATAVPAGLVLMFSGLGVRRPKVEIDTIRHEIRLVRTHGKDRFIEDRCKFSDLVKVEHTDSHVRLWGTSSAPLAEVTARDAMAFRSLVTALRVAGKI
jgi:hypothetical protein